MVTINGASKFEITVPTANKLTDGYRIHANGTLRKIAFSKARQFGRIPYWLQAEVAENPESEYKIVVHYSLKSQSGTAFAWILLKKSGENFIFAGISKGAYDQKYRSLTKMFQVAAEFYRKQPLMLRVA